MKRPNIIFILIDDLGWRDLSCYGSSFYETPNLDRLAGESMRFTEAYAACPVCSPTRASIMSGKYPATVGVTNFIPGESRGRLLEAPYIKYLPAEEHSLAAAMGEGGYDCWHVGKWHLGGADYWPDKHGFDVNVGGCDWGMPHNGYFSPWGIPTLPDGPEGEYLTDHLTDRAIELMRSRGDRPFFLNLWYYSVHIPVQAPEALVEKYRAKAARLGLDRQEAMEIGEPFPCQHKADQRVCRRRFQSDPVYAAMVEQLDTNIGRLRAALDELGLAEDTMIVFTSDNGGLATAEGSPTCNAPLAEGKGWMYEGGTREPLIVHWPGVTSAGTSAAVVTSPDFYPTLLEMAGLDPIPDQHVDGVSFAPVLRGEPMLPREAIYWHYPHYANQGGTPGCSVRSGKWKLIEFFEDGRHELYDLNADVGETRNLVAEYPDVADRLVALLRQWLEDVDAKIPQPNPDYTPPAAAE